MALIRHRITARVLLQAKSGRFLMFFTHWDPESGLKPRWVIPGGGIEGNEPVALAASRELQEETGFWVEPDLLGVQLATLEFTQQWSNGDHETGAAHIFHFVVEEEFEPEKTHWTEEEHRDILANRWWQLEDLIASGESVGPPGLVDLMRSLSD